MELIFQLTLTLFIFLSFILVVTVPVIFASQDGWEENKNYILYSSTLWGVLVLVIGGLNSFVI